MRTIKFRAWDKEKQDGMLHFDLDGLQKASYRYVVNGKFVSSYGGGSALYNLDKFELMQFTGLLDKNGKEIYEGDIMVSRTEGVGNRVVKWTDQNGAYFVVSNSFTEKVDWDNCLTEQFVRNFSYKIIGNIYENPDLLQENKLDI